MLLSAMADDLLGDECVLKAIHQSAPDLLQQCTEYVTSAEAKWNLHRLMVEAMTPASAPTAVSTPTVSPALKAARWDSETRSQREIIAAASNALNNLLKNPMYGDSTWTALIAVQVGRLQEADDALRVMVPPEECWDAHLMLLSASLDGVLGAEYFLMGAQQLDVDLLEQSGEYAKSAGAKLDLFRAMREALIP